MLINLVRYINTFGYTTTQQFTVLCLCQFLFYIYTKILVTKHFTVFPNYWPSTDTAYSEKVWFL